MVATILASGIARVVRALLLVATSILLLITASAGARERGWVAHGPDGGYVAVLELDPQRPSIVYAGGYAGLYKSTDSGRSWRRASVGLPADTRVVYLELAPSEPSTLYLIGGPGFFRSTNRGSSWQRLAAPETGAINDLEVDPTRANRVYLAAWVGIFRSDDGGASWRNIAPGSHDFVAVAPAAANVIYSGTSAGLVRSADGGATWTLMPTAYVGRVDAFAIDPRDPDTIYYRHSATEFYKSTDGGRHYRLALKTPAGEWISATAIDRRDPRRLVVAAQTEAYSSTNGGATWKRLSRGLPQTDQTFDLELASGSDGPAYVSFYAHGVYKTTSDGRRWRFSSRGLAASWVRSLAVDSRSPAIVYAGLDDAGVARSTNGGLRWTRRRSEPTIFVVASAGHAAYAAGNDGVFRTRDRGATWKRVWSTRHSPEVMTSLAIAPSAPNVIYAGSGLGGIYRSSNGGRSWRTLLRFEPYLYAKALAVHPTRAQSLWAVVGGSVLRSVNGGRTWKGRQTRVGGFEALAVNPRNPRILYASAYSQKGYPGGGVYKSLDGGSSWKRTSRGIDTTGMCSRIDERHPSTLYAGGCDDDFRGGAYRSTNGARSWTKISTGMTRTCVFSLALTPSGRTLHIGTVRGGVFTKRVG